jgi:hypothetical protein
MNIALSVERKRQIENRLRLANEKGIHAYAEFAFYGTSDITVLFDEVERLTADLSRERKAVERALSMASKANHCPYRGKDCHRIKGDCNNCRHDYAYAADPAPDGEKGDKS